MVYLSEFYIINDADMKHIDVILYSTITNMYISWNKSKFDMKELFNYCHPTP